MRTDERNELLMEFLAFLDENGYLYLGPSMEEIPESPYHAIIEEFNL